MVTYKCINMFKKPRDNWPLLNSVLLNQVHPKYRKSMNILDPTIQVTVSFTFT